MVDMVVKDCQLFSLVEDEGFRAFVGKLDPTYILPTTNSLNHMVEDKYKALKEKIKEDLKKVACVSLTSDMWTSENMDTFMGVTCHFLQKGKLQSRLLGVSKFPQSDTADSFKEAQELLIADWGLKHKLVCIITNNIANMTRCAQLMKINHISCFAHTLNLVVKKAIEDTSGLAHIRSKARKIVGLFKSSTMAKERLTCAQEQLGMSQPKLLQEVETQWNSTYLMLQCLYYQSEPIAAALANLSTEITPLSSDDLEAINQSLLVLSSFHEVTQELSAETVSCSKVIPLHKLLQHAVRAQLATIKHLTAVTLGEKLMENLRARQSPENDHFLQAATFLDPRFKLLGFENQAKAQEAEKYVTSKCVKLIKLPPRPPPPSAVSEDPTPGPSSQPDQPKVWQAFDHKVHQSRKQQNPTAEAIIEVQRYLTDRHLDRKEDPLAYWQKNYRVFPHLSKLAQVFLAIPATSASCEQIFSKAGQVTEKRRNCLEPKNLDKILFLNENQHIV